MKTTQRILKMVKKIIKKNLFPHIPLRVPIIAIQTTNYCNLDCYFCPNRKSNRHVLRGYMEFDLFKKIVDEYKTIGGSVIRFTAGEHLMHPHILKFITYCKRKNIKVRFTTNGQLFNESLVKAITLMDNVENINFSVEGCDKISYEQIRKSGNYEKLIYVLHLFKKYKKRNNSLLQIRIQSVLTRGQDNEAYLREFIQHWKIFCDRFHFMKVGTKSGNYKDISLNRYNNDHSLVCESFFKTLTVKFDGLVSACCADYANNLIVGDIKTTLFKKIWHSEKISYFRKMAKRRKYHAISVSCVNCTNISSSYRMECENLNNLALKILNSCKQNS